MGSGEEAGGAGAVVEAVVDLVGERGRRPRSVEVDRGGDPPRRAERMIGVQLGGPSRDRVDVAARNGLVDPLPSYEVTDHHRELAERVGVRDRRRCSGHSVRRGRHADAIVLPGLVAVRGGVRDPSDRRHRRPEPDRAGRGARRNRRLALLPRHLYYFSFVTLTSLGYGDISPLHDGPRILATLEAVVGAIVLTALVGRIVGMLVAQLSRREAG